MKFTIKNLKPSARNIPLPGGKSIPVEANGVSVQFYPQGLQGFFAALRKIGFEVTMEPSKQEIAMANARPGIRKPVQVTSAPKKAAPKKEAAEPVVETKPVEEKPVEAVAEPVEEAKPVEEPVAEEAPVEEAKDVPSRQEILDMLRALKVEQLKAICEKLDIPSGSNKMTTLVGKISNSDVSDADIFAAYNSVVG